jgi:putative hemolysin
MDWPDFLSQHVFDLLAMLVALVLAACVNGTEAAMFSLSPGQLYRMRSGGHRSAGLVPKLLATPRRLLNAILLMNLLVTTALAGLTAVIVLDIERQGHHAVAVVASILPLLALILVGEMVPKMLGFAAPVGWSTLAAWPMLLLSRGLAPILWVLEKAVVNPLLRIVAPAAASRDITSDELASLLDLSARRGHIARDANRLLREIVQLSDLRVSDIMVPRVDMIAYDIHDGRDGLVKLFNESHLRKIPVYDSQPDAVVGVIYGRDLLLGDNTRSLRDLAVAVPFVPAAGAVERLLVQFRVTRKQMAMVVDEFGGIAGLVTLTDIVEEIVGDIPGADAEPAEPTVQRLDGSAYMLDGDLPIHDLADALGVSLVAARVTSVGGFLVSLLGRVPKPGDSARHRNLKFTVVSTRRRRVDKLRLELLQGAKGGGA